MTLIFQVGHNLTVFQSNPHGKEAFYGNSIFSVPEHPKHPYKEKRYYIIIVLSVLRDFSLQKVKLNALIWVSNLLVGRIRLINFHFIFCWLHTYHKQFENLKSLKIFKSALVCQTYVFFPQRVPLFLTWNRHV